MALRKLKVTVVFEEDRHGFFAHCPQLQGCYSQGKTFEEARRNITDAIRLHVRDRLAAGEPLPQVDGLSLTQLEITV